MKETVPGSILSEIVKVKKTEVARIKEIIPLWQLEKEIKKLPPTRSFASQLRQPGKITLIAELKKRSPSKGLIRWDFNVIDITRAYTRSGAAAISVLTDTSFFGGKPEYLGYVRKNTHLPVLCKEFIIDPYQLYRARALGADAVLLIVKILSFDQLTELMELAEKLGLEVLVETHNEEEIQQALAAKAKIIGINNRNLDTFRTDINTTLRLRKEITDPDITVVSESGIRSPLDMEKLAKHNVHAALVGETLMRQANLDRAVQELLSVNTREVG